MILFGNNTVTLFNRHFDRDSGEEIWIPTVLSNVNIVIKKESGIKKSGQEDADTAKLFVDESCSDSKSYLDVKMWDALPLEEKKTFYTFGHGRDFFVEGDLSGEDTKKEGFYNYMIAEKSNVFVVTSVERYEDVMPHMEIGGK